MNIRTGQLIVLLAVLVSLPVSAGGGAWRMGPFGPYWDENEWPEFTPMYWMEEFLNRINNDDDAIQAWMLRNQYLGQYPGAMSPGAVSPYAWQQPWPAYQQAVPPYSPPIYNAPAPQLAPPGAEVPPSTASRYPQEKPLPELTLEEFLRMPDELQREYKREFERRYYGNDGRGDLAGREKTGIKKPAGRSLRRLTPEEYARLSPEQQRAYRRELIRRDKRTQSGGGRRGTGSLPRLTPEEFAKMPPELQRAYRQEFARIYGLPAPAVSPTESNRVRRPLPNLTPQEYARMPPELQREYQRAFEREYGDFLRRQQRAARLRNPSGR